MPYIDGDEQTALLLAHTAIKDLYPSEIRAAIKVAVDAQTDEHTRWRLTNLAEALARVAAIYGEDNA